MLSALSEGSLLMLSILSYWVFLLNKEEETKVQKVSDLFRVTQLVSIETMTQT